MAFKNSQMSWMCFESIAILTGETPFHSPSSLSVCTTFRNTVIIPTRPELKELNSDKWFKLNLDCTITWTYVCCKCHPKVTPSQSDIFRQSKRRMCALVNPYPGCMLFCNVCSRVLTRSRGWKRSVEQVPLKAPHMKALMAG